MSKTTVLATGRITGAEIITITHVEWSDSPPVVMIRWPGQPSLTDPNRLPAVANELMAIMAAASAKLDAIQRQQPHSGRKSHGATSSQGFLGSGSLRAAHDAVLELTSNSQDRKSIRASKSAALSKVSQSTSAATQQ